MKKTRNVFRLIFFLLTVFLILYINRKTDDQAETIIDFKFKMLEKIQTDSLNSKHKADLLLNETSKFIDGSSLVRTGIHCLTGLLGMVVVVELGFYILAKRNSGVGD